MDQDVNGGLGALGSLTESINTLSRKLVSPSQNRHSQYSYFQFNYWLSNWPDEEAGALEQYCGAVGEAA